ncbi:hypothetical protein B9Z55_027930 [Caenorhabditis nigoni]|uniref:Uncharacterized protein n=1 Tax=Caenorhabditis nigoni TaxID=1611254 RepID=A0A2G5SDQ7_9PELO|nr:hypothetical protein B9Z55_027930 [Caenorhabditis nigoni]
MYRRGPQHVANIQVTCGYHTSNSQLAVNQRSPKKQFLSHRQWKIIFPPDDVAFLRISNNKRVMSGV